jgi:hypothetical protein
MAYCSGMRLFYWLVLAFLTLCAFAAPGQEWIGWALIISLLAVLLMVDAMFFSSPADFAFDPNVRRRAGLSRARAPLAQRVVEPPVWLRAPAPTLALLFSAAALCGHRSSRAPHTTPPLLPRCSSKTTRATRLALRADPLAAAPLARPLLSLLLQ